LLFSFLIDNNHSEIWRKKKNQIFWTANKQAIKTNYKFQRFINLEIFQSRLELQNLEFFSRILSKSISVIDLQSKLSITSLFITSKNVRSRFFPIFYHVTVALYNENLFIVSDFWRTTQYFYMVNTLSITSNKNFFFKFILKIFSNFALR
jgi:hypothetical protein